MIPHRFSRSSFIARRRQVLAAASVGLTVVAAACIAGGSQMTTADAAVAPQGQGFQLNRGDMRFILKQIKISEAHATKENGPGTPLVGDGEFQISDPMLPFGLRTVDGSDNNLIPGQNSFGASHQKFPRLSTPVFRSADVTPPAFGPPTPTSYAQKSGNVFDAEPRLVSNLIVDQTSTNPAAIQAAAVPHRTFLGEPVVPCDSGGQPAGCVPSGKTLFMPNVTTDVGLSPPFNSWFTLFGQFFDHGVDLTTKGGSGTVFVPLKADDPLIPGPDGVLGNGDDLPANQRFMVLTRATNQPGPDGILGNADDIHEAINTDTPWVDQSQTYTSHPAHQVFLREYDLLGGRPVSNGMMLRGPQNGMGTWKTAKDQARTKLGIVLTDADVANVPLVATDQYGRFLRGPLRGMPQLVTATGLVEGNIASPVSVPGNVRRIGDGFLVDIAHNADPKPGLTPDSDTNISTANQTQPSGTYDNELLDEHFVAGDGRVNENIGLTAVHQVFHSEHNRLVDDMKNLITTQNIDVAEWHLTGNPTQWNGERLFQAAKFVTEMEYQHLVFEEFGRKVAPSIDPFNATTQAQTNLNPAIKAEFAHAVYRFGHSMLTDTVSRTRPDGSSNDIELLDAFLNPRSYYDDGTGPNTMTPEEAAGSIVMGMADQTGNEIDEFVTETLRNNLLGLPLDLPTINMTRARDAGVPPLNVFRRQLHAATRDASLKPYSDWVDFSQSIKHERSTVNFIAAYGTHPTITSQSTIAGRRAAAEKLFAMEPTDPATPADAAAFMFGTGAWANNANGATKTGVDGIDLWIGGLAESQNLFGGLLGSTFNYVFEQQMTDLQDGDRFYYLTRTPGLNLRTQLEGNSFAELIQRNTDAHGLKADVFSVADCEFDLAHLQGTTPGPITDDPTSECDEHALLLRMADGTIRYRQSNSVDPGGLNAQATYEGTPGADRVWGGVDNDTFWGGLGNDRIEGNDGGDVALGGEGDDIITDSAGDDNLKGGPGNDAIDAGPGLDLLQPGAGDDFADGGLNSNGIFAGEGDDLLMGGDGADGMFGDGGDDWLDGGRTGDGLSGDSGNNFFTDDNEPGHDVMFSGGGEANYDAEGGDDIMQNTADHDRNAGAMGYDWVIHRGSAAAADSDLNLAIAVLPQPHVVVRDRFSEIEAVSGWKLDDALRGNGAEAEIAIPANRNDLNAAGIARIAGLQTVLGAGVTSLRGDQNVILGGGGSDILEGREGDDFLDGDRWLDAQLRAPDQSTPSTTDTKLVDNLADIRDDLMAGRTNPGQVDIVRSIKTEPAGSEADAAVFSGPRADYDITPNLNRTLMTVNHARGTASDGVDTLRNIEQLRFSDQTLSIAPVAVFAPNLTFAARALNTNSAAQSVLLSNTGSQLLSIASINIVGTNPGDFNVLSTSCGASLAPGASCSTNVRFRPTAAGTRTAVLRATNNSGNIAGSTQDVTLSGVGNAPPVVNTPATGSPTLSDTTPAPQQTLTAITTGISDVNGLGPFTYQWQRTNPNGNVNSFANVNNATAVTFNVPNQGNSLGRRYRVIVRFTDGAGFAEQRTSAASARTTPNLNLLATGLTALGTSSTPLQIAAAVPAGAPMTEIAVFALPQARTQRAKPKARLITKVTRSTPKAKRYTFKLTEKKLKNLRPGTYVVEVRVGKNRASLGPAVRRNVTIRAARP
ncbi:MAG: heme peroxidase [Thermoleophilia bacterium]|nr:heme peroxidase [Thermoleophilia bacterium]